MLRDLRESRVWQEAFAEGFKEGFEKGFEFEGVYYRKDVPDFWKRALVQFWVREGKTLKEIAAVLHWTTTEVRRLSRVRRERAKPGKRRPIHSPGSVTAAASP